ncbi:MAG TPA: exodeoxyribonuclease VII small subunit [Blastocatellia bacterium]|nr:exodeoxyribonuclease VII small subunit [Blastocatellia bacterium]
MAKAKDKELSFEESLGTLEKIVAQLESGELPLERALELFEEGVGLARRCQTQLEEAERKVELLLRERGEIRTVPFEAKPEVSSGESEKNNISNPLNNVSMPLADIRGKAIEDDKAFDESIPF